MIKTKEKENCLIMLFLDKELDAHVVTELRKELGSFAKKNKAVLILDFSQVELIDSSGLAGIIAVIKQLGVKNSLLLCGLQERPLALVKLMSLDKLLAIYNTEQDALSSLNLQV